MELICKHCGAPVGLDSARTTEDGDIICSSCARNHYTKCGTCSNYIPLSEFRHVCKVCDEVVYTKPINNYSLKPIPRFKGKKFSSNSTGRYFGLEMEFNRVTPDSAFIIFKDLYKDKWLYNKHDGSISSGVEIVTNPLDKYNVKQLLDKMSTGLERISKTRGYRDNAGIHIHVNRKSIDPIDIYKLGYLLNYRSSSYEKRIIYYIAGRNNKSTTLADNYHYCKIGNVPTKRNMNSTRDRYQALNLGNRETIEFRIFSASADPTQIAMYVDFVNDMIEYCHSHGLKDINIASFITWEMQRKDNNPKIKQKVNNFFKYNGAVQAIQNIYKVDINILRGIHVTKYKDIIDNLKYCGNIRDVITLVDWARVGDASRMPLSRDMVHKFGQELALGKTIENTLRKVLINDIMKGLKECA